MPHLKWRCLAIGALTVVVAALGVRLNQASASAIPAKSRAVVVATGRVVLAQAGSIGGSVGRRNKSISGGRSVPASKPTVHRPEKRTSTRRRRPRSSRSADRFDGMWTSAISGTTCSGTGVSVITGGRIVADGVSGHVNPNGSLSAVSHGGGLTIFYRGRLSGHHGSGTFRRSDGCVGRWTAVKQ